MNRRELLKTGVAATVAAGVPGILGAREVVDGYYGAIRSQADWDSFRAFMSRHPLLPTFYTFCPDYEEFDRRRAGIEEITRKENVTPILDAWMREEKPHLVRPFDPEADGIAQRPREGLQRA
jgi:hypothetical protein